MYRICKAIYVTFILVAVLGIDAARGFNQTGAIRGTVTDGEGHPLPAVNVSLPQLTKGAVTDVKGNYKVGNVPFGRYNLVFSLVGYERKVSEVVISSSKPVIVDIQLKQTVLESESITVTGSPYASDPLEVAADVSSISGVEKLQHESASLGASLENMAGVTNISTGSQVGKPVIRGLSGNRIRVMSNGTPMDYQQFGVRHLPNVDPVLADRIEVVRGASSVLYGSDALGGAVNVIPRRAPHPSEQRASVRGQIISSYATNNLERMAAWRLEGTHGQLGWTGTLVRRIAGDLRTPDIATYSESGKDKAPKFAGQLSHTNYEQLNGHFALGYATAFGRIDAHYTRWNSEQNFLLPTGEGQGQYLSNDMAQLKMLVSKFDNWIIRGKLNYTHNLRKAAQPGYDYSELNDQTLDLNLSNDSYSGRLVFEHSKLLGLSGQFGAEYQLTDKKTMGPEPLVPSGQIRNLGVFAFEERKWGPLKLSAGLRFDTRHQKAYANDQMNLPDYQAGETDAVLKQRYDVFSGSLGAVYRLSPNLTLASNMSRGFRAPSIFELHVEGVHGGVAAYQVGNPGLDEELSLNTDLSLRWQSDQFRGKVTIYRNAIRNYIYLSETDRTRDGLQVWETTQDDARLLGGDATLQLHLMRGMLVKATYEMVRGELTASGNELPMLPADKISLTAKSTRSRLAGLHEVYFAIQGNHSFSKEAAGTYEPFAQFDRQPFGTASTRAYSILDLRAGFAFKLAEHRAAIDFSIQNVLNEDYRDFLDTYKGYALGTGRNFTAKISVPFDIIR